jgi:hypothetical protein
MTTPAPDSLDCPLTDSSPKLQADQRREYILALIRVARARCQVTVHDLDHIGLALKCGVISPAQAVAMLREIGADEMALRIPPEVKLGAA